jgi:DNA processing protein
MALSRVDALGPASQARLVGHFGSARAALAAGRATWQDCGIRRAETLEGLAACDIAVQERILQRLGDVGGVALAHDDPRFPTRLREIAAFPLVLFCCGDVGLLSYEGLLAVVGTRKMSEYGQRATEAFLKPVVAAGVSIVSGLAFGVDALAHQICLTAGVKTIAVQAIGVDRGSPRSHQGLYERIIAQGCVVSEFPFLERQFDKGLFPRRNRLISGLARGVLVVEADLQSGALITARYAIEQNRDLYAVPGDVFRKNSEGCHYLIREGARPVTTAADILSDFLPDWAAQAAAAGPLTSRVATDALESPLERRIFDLCREVPLLPDEILMQVAEPAPVVLALLTKMELKGTLSETPGRRYLAVS